LAPDPNRGDSGWGGIRSQRRPLENPGCSLGEDAAPAAAPTTSPLGLPQPRCLGRSVVPATGRARPGRRCGCRRRRSMPRLWSRHRARGALLRPRRRLQGGRLRPMPCHRRSRGALLPGHPDRSGSPTDTMGGCGIRTAGLARSNGQPPACAGGTLRPEPRATTFRTSDVVTGPPQQTRPPHAVTADRPLGYRTRPRPPPSPHGNRPISRRYEARPP
jgi:hypothetical protein